MTLHGKHFERNQQRLMSGSIYGRFTETHIGIVWTFLHNKFGFDIPKWKKKFNEFHRTSRYDHTVTSNFFRFGNLHINPVLNQILQRSSSHDTFNKMIEYILKHS